MEKDRFISSNLSTILKRNAIGSLIIKGIGFLLNIAIIPVSLNFVGDEVYGIWITLFSIITWFTLFDGGFGNSLRNRLAVNLAKGEIEVATGYVTTSYVALGTIMIVLLFTFFIVNNFLSWDEILNTRALSSQSLASVTLVLFSFFAVNMMLGNITFIMLADQKTAMSGAIRVLSNLITLGILFILQGKVDGSLMLLVLAVVIPNSFVLLLFTVILFWNRYKPIRPRIGMYNKRLLKDLWSLGAAFFVIQISYIILFTTDNLIITRLFNPSEVTPYNIAYRYFNSVVMVFGLLTSPLWSAITAAYANKNFYWIRKVINKSLILFGMFSLCVIVMLIFSDEIIYFWLGRDLKIDFWLRFMMALYSVVYMFNAIFIYFLNGTGKIRLQLIYSIVAGVVNIPLSIILAKYTSLGVTGVIAATLTLQVLATLWIPYQYYLIINGKGKGIWLK
ncbi:MAG: O-antigen membrane protein [Chlorobi bacterium OLB4]|jgi:O-antigen/teichoic acid export membrane protein|nr:MAG: O-antigen membrane protein [Chlorobi bacterium OLB4]MBW7856160.1 MATE family efflux transporter [Ignavibacteria bacterium]OQY78026.1 MAG: hypothetical protein B6D43_05795 [Ignavibacteriales bacterium UTCHB1]